MTREPAQAGNRASRTEHYLQWWENSPEWNAETSAVDKRHNSSFSFGSCREPAAAVLAVASLRLLVGGAGYATIFAKRPRKRARSRRLRQTSVPRGADRRVQGHRRRRLFGHCDARELAPSDANRFAFAANNGVAVTCQKGNGSAAVAQQAPRYACAEARAFAAVARVVWHTAKIVDGAPRVCLAPFAAQRNRKPNTLQESGHVAGNRTRGRKPNTWQETDSETLRGRKLNPGLPRDRRKY